MWLECSKTCGPAVKFRPVLCTQIIQDRRRVVPDSSCKERKPNKLAKCNQPLCWVTDPWTKVTDCVFLEKLKGNQSKKMAAIYSGFPCFPVQDC